MPLVMLAVSYFLGDTFDRISDQGIYRIIQDVYLTDDGSPRIHLDWHFISALVLFLVVPWLLLTVLRSLYHRFFGLPSIGNLPPISEEPVSIESVLQRSQGGNQRRLKRRAAAASPGKKSGTRQQPTPLSRIYVDEETIDCYDPATGESLGQCKAATAEAMQEIVEETREAALASKFAQSSFDQRRQILSTLLELVVRRRHVLSEMSCRETGKAMPEAVLGEVLTACEKIRWTIANGERWLSREYRSVGLMLHKRAWVEWQPRGVAGVIVPWNYPVHHAISHATTSIMAGNACVIKCSEWTAWSAAYLESLCGDALEACGWPRTLVRVVPGWADAGRSLIAHSDTLLFIGSTPVGKKVMAAAAETLTPVQLELGGVDPFIVTDNADLEHAVDNCLRASFLNCGQNCIACCRVYVYESVYDEFIDRVRREMARLRQGHYSEAVDLGAMVMPGQTERLVSLLDDARAQGARILEGGGEPDVDELVGCKGTEDGQFFAPTLVVDCTQSMRIVQEEPFAPIMTVIRVPDDSDERAIEMANDCQYGLSCSVYSRDQSRAVRIGKQVLSGMTSINDFGFIFFVQAMPFGGARLSGFGKFNGPEGLRAQCLQRMFVVDRIPGIVFQVPPPLRYPFHNALSPAVLDLVAAIYGSGFSQRARALGKFLSGCLFRYKK